MANHMDLHGHPFFRATKEDSTEVSPLLLNKILQKMLHQIPSLGPGILTPHPVLVLGTPNAHPQGPGASTHILVDMKAILQEASMFFHWEACGLLP